MSAPSPQHSSFGWRVAGAVGIAGGLLYALQDSRLLLGPLLRTALSYAAGKEGWEVSFGDVSGSLYSGRLVVKELRVAPHADREVLATTTKPYANLVAGRVGIEFSLRDLLSNNRVLNAVEVERVSGMVKLPPEDRKDEHIETHAIIKKLKVSQTALVLYKDFSKAPVFVRIEHLAGENLRPTHLAADLLLRSTVRGTLEEAPFALNNNGIHGVGEAVTLTLDELPVHRLKALAPPKSPLNWLDEGFATISVDVVRMANEGPQPLRANGTILISSLQAGLSENAAQHPSRVVKAAARSAVTWVNKSIPERDIVLNGAIRFSEDQLVEWFRGHDLKALGKALRSETTEMLKAKAVDKAKDFAREQAEKMFPSLSERRQGEL